jgi:hypothetical protein
MHQELGKMNLPLVLPLHVRVLNPGGLLAERVQPQDETSYARTVLKLRQMYGLAS